MTLTPNNKYTPQGICLNSLNKNILKLNLAV